MTARDEKAVANPVKMQRPIKKKMEMSKNRRMESTVS
jgi:hypothetical protein